MNTPKFDPTKPVRTRDGRAARIICTDANFGQPIIALTNDSGQEIPRRYDLDGSWGGSHQSNHDLINIPERIRREVWINVYKEAMGHNSPTKKEADLLAASNRLACVRVEIDCEIGEGL